MNGILIVFGLVLTFLVIAFLSLPWRGYKPVCMLCLAGTAIVFIPLLLRVTGLSLSVCFLKLGVGAGGAIMLIAVLLFLEQMKERRNRARAGGNVQ